MTHFAGFKHPKQATTDPNRVPQLGDEDFVPQNVFQQKLQDRRRGNDIKIPRLLSDILSPTAGFLASATDSDLQRRQRRRLGKRALRTLQIGSSAPVGAVA